LCGCNSIASQRRGFHNIGLEAQPCKKNGFLRFAYHGNSAVAVTFLTNGLVIARTATPSRDIGISRERSPWMSLFLSRKYIEMSLTKCKTEKVNWSWRRRRASRTDIKNSRVHRDVCDSRIEHNFELAMRQSLGYKRSNAD